MAKIINGFLVGIIGDHVYFVKNGKQCRRKRPVHDKTKPISKKTKGTRDEFGKIQGSIKLFKQAFEEVIRHTNDGNLHTNLTKELFTIKNYDQGAIGTRSVNGGLKTERGLSHLKGFNFVNKTYLNINCSRHLDKETGILTLKNLVPRQCHNKRMDCLGYILYWAKIDFEAMSFTMEKSKFITADGNSFEPLDLKIPVEQIPTGSGVNFFVLLCTFSIQLNANTYCKGDKDVAQVIEVFY